MGATESAAPREKKKSRARAELEGGVWELFAELFALQRSRMMALCREFDLFPPQLLVLKALDRPRPMREVAETMACDSSNLTGITDRLEERGLVRRSSDENDRRVKLLVLSEEGTRLRGAVLAGLDRPPPGVEALGDRDLRDLQRLLRKAAAGA
jgi:MarR family transcriptional regulator, organic hydroperoxide resistance regulator